MQLADVAGKTADFSRPAHLCDLFAFCGHHGHDIGIERCDRPGYEAANEHDDEPDREQTHGQCAKRQKHFLPQHLCVEMRIRNRQGRMQGRSERDARREVVGNREGPGLEDDIRSIFLFKGCLQLQKTIGLHRNLHQESIFPVAGGRPAEGYRIDEQGIDDPRPFTGGVDIGPVAEFRTVGQLAGEIELCLIDLRKRIPAVFEVVLGFQPGVENRKGQVARGIVQ